MIRGVKAATQAALGRIYQNNYPELIRWGAVERPHYAYIVYQAAELARRLGVQRISVIEFGVAGGRGLLNLEHHAKRVSQLTGVNIDVYGFDTGEGLPPPIDYRDLPYIWKSSHFRMDQHALQAKLKNARLVLGNVADTVGSFVEQYAPAPIGAIAFDLDYYSSTIEAFRIFNIPEARRQPRIFCYFDDIFSSDLGHVGPAVGVPLAINEFNRNNTESVLSELNHLEFEYRPVRRWHRQIYSFCDFDHPRADEYIIDGDRQLEL